MKIEDKVVKKFRKLIEIQQRAEELKLELLLRGSCPEECENPRDRITEFLCDQIGC